jgi:dTDP-4-dehydrorhamnose reductase
MKIILIGASSYVGSRIYFDLKDKFEIVGTYNNNPLSKSFIKLDITKKDDVLQVFREVKPEVVIHVANYSSPRSAVNNEENFIKLNDEGTNNVVVGANEIGAKVIFISSQAANNVADLYGKLKAKSEVMVAATQSGYLILRPSYIVGFSPNTTNPRPFNRILKCIDDRNVIGEFDTSWKLQPTYVGHLSQMIDRAIITKVWNRAIPMFIDELVTQYQIAKDILGSFDIEVKETDQHITIPPSRDSLEEFNTFGFFPHTYREMIETITKEIKERNKFKLDLIS